MLAIPTLNVESGGLRAESAGTDNDAGYADEVRDIGRCKASNRSLGDRGVDEELMFRQGLCELEVFFAS